MKYLWPAFFCLLTHNVFAQKLNFEILYQHQPVIQEVNILFKQRDDVKEYTNIKGGKGNYVLQNKYQDLLIEIRAFGFKNEQYIINNIKPNKTYHIKISLHKLEQLKEVVLFSRKKITVKKDTVTYDVKSFTKPTDVKVVDVLARLPGIEIDEQTGKIKFNGNPIETVLLDGDNLFDSNYTVATQNINIKAIDKIQAIEHYRENPLLKKIINGNGTVLNLKLKKNQTDFSGDISLSGGFNADNKLKTDSGATLLGVNQKIKSFGVVNFNNLGIDYAPIDIFERIENGAGRKKNYYTFAPVSNYIGRTQNIAKEYQNFNNQLFTNANVLFRINKKVKVRTNLFYLSDKKVFNQTLDNFVKSTPPIYYSSNTSQKQIPVLYRANIKLISKPDLNNYLTNVLHIDYQPVRFKSQIVKNHTDKYADNTFTKDVYFSNLLDYTHLYNNKFALHLLQQFDFNGISQNYAIADTLEQISDNRSHTAFLKLEGVGNGAIFPKYRVGFSTQYRSFDHNNSIDYSVTSDAEQYRNQYDFFKLAQFFSTDYLFGKIEVKPRYEIAYYSFAGGDNNKERLKLNVNFHTRYTVDIQNDINFGLGFTQKPLSINKRHNYLLYTDFRTKIRYHSLFDFQDSKFVNIQYFFNNLFPILHIRTGISFKKNTGYMYPDFIRNQNQTEIIYKYSEGNQHQIFTYFYFDKYFSKIKSTLTFKTDYSFFENQIVSNNLSKYIKLNNYNISFSYSTAFKSFFNLSNTIKYTVNTNQISHLDYWNDKLKLFFNFNKYTMILTHQFTRYRDNEMYYFSDMEISRSFSKSLRLKIVARNLFNETNYQTIEISDDLYTKSQINLQPRMLFIAMRKTF